MNTKAAICREVLDETMLDIDTLGARLGLTEKMRDSVISLLCGEGVLRRTGNNLTVKNAKRALEFANSEPLAKTAPADPTPRLPAKPSAIALPSEFKIEKGIPLAAGKNGRMAREPRFPFAQMEIGDSFSVPVPSGTQAKEVADLLQKDATNFRRTRPHFKTAIRTAPTGDEVRCWRIEGRAPRQGNGHDSKGTKVGKALAKALL